MFTISDALTDLKVKERSIFKMLYSMNSPQVATPDSSSEEARCYVLFFSEGPNLSAYIGLYLPRIDRKMFYVYSSNPFPFEAAPDVEVEATGFAEDMGFLLDEINVSGMTVDDRNRWIEEQYIFGYKKPNTTEDNFTVTIGEKPKSALDKKEEEREARARIEEEMARTVQAEKEETQAKAEVEKAKAEVEKAKAEVEKAKAEAEAEKAKEEAEKAKEEAEKAKEEAEKAKAEVEAEAEAEAEEAQPSPYEEPVLQAEPERPQQQPEISVPQPEPEQPKQQPEISVTPLVEPQSYQPIPPEVQPEPPVNPQATPDQIQTKGLPAFSQKNAPPAEQVKPSVAKKKVHKTTTPPPPVEAFEEPVPVEMEEESTSQRTQSMIEKALKEGVMKPPKPKAAKTKRSIGVVARDKEALARLLASF